MSALPLWSLIWERDWRHHQSNFAFFLKIVKEVHSLPRLLTVLLTVHSLSSCFLQRSSFIANFSSYCVDQCDQYRKGIQPIWKKRPARRSDNWAKNWRIILDRLGKEKYEFSYPASGISQAFQVTPMCGPFGDYYSFLRQNIFSFLRKSYILASFSLQSPFFFLYLSRRRCHGVRLDIWHLLSQ